MKKLLLVLMCVCILSSICMAQMVSDNKQIPGGYTKIAVTDKEVTDAVSFMKKSFPAIRIDAVNEAFKQVVAGLNIRLVCNVSAMGGKDTWEMVIYKDLKGNYFLTGAKSVKK